MASEDSESSNKAIRKSAQVTGHDFIPHFKIPVRKEQLCDEPANENQFFVKDRINLNNLSEDRVLEEIERVSNKIGGNGSSCLQILNNDYFDILYSIVYYIDDQSLKVRREVIQLLQQGLKNTKHYMDMRKMWEFAETNLLTSSMIQNQELMDAQFKIIVLIQNSIKAYVYLITWFMSDNSKLKENRDLALSKKKKKGAEQADGERYANAIMMATNECVKLFISFVEQDMKHFWPEHRIDEDFINLFIRASFDMLENPNNIKN
jgi:hypothetical protein